MTLNSKNSSKPPASDPNRKKGQRKKSDKSSGGQKSHIGTTLQKQARHATSRNSGTPVTLIRSPTQRMGYALNALRP